MSKEELKKTGEELTNNVSELYANNLRLAVSVHDFTFNFGLTGVDRDGAEIAKDIVTIKVSPQFAKVIAEILQNNISKYESKIGEIHLPERTFKEINIKG